MTVINYGPGGGTSGAKTLKINAAASTTVSDDFNRANSNPLSGNWTTVPGANNLQLLNDAVSTTADNQYGTSAADAYWNANTFSSDQGAQATLLTTETGVYSGPIVRASSSTLTYYALNSNTTNNMYVLYKVLNGVETPIQVVYQTPQIGDVIKIVAIGNTINGYVNGVLIATQIDSDITGGSPGIECSQVNAATPTLDKWSGWSVVGAGTQPS